MTGCVSGHGTHWVCNDADKLGRVRVTRWRHGAECIAGDGAMARNAKEVWRVAGAGDGLPWWRRLAALHLARVIVRFAATGSCWYTTCKRESINCTLHCIEYMI